MTSKKLIAILKCGHNWLKSTNLVDLKSFLLNSKVKEKAMILVVQLPRCRVSDYKIDCKCQNMIRFAEIYKLCLLLSFLLTSTVKEKKRIL